MVLDVEKESHGDGQGNDQPGDDLKPQILEMLLQFQSNDHSMVRQMKRSLPNPLPQSDSRFPGGTDKIHTFRLPVPG
jgi:hypothetical protein